MGIIQPQSENSVVVYFEQCISENILFEISQLKAVIEKQSFKGFIEAVPGYASLTVYYDPLKVMYNDKLTGSTASEKIIYFIQHLPVQAINNNNNQKIIEIPVCYEDEFGLDLKTVSELTGLNKEEIIQLHSEALYTVFMIGFIPGFAYLGGMNKLLYAPRRTSPRSLVTAGSIGIAGEQTGIYPLNSPGGWQLVGRTPLRMFDVCSNPPARLQAGDKVKFIPITLNEYAKLSQL